MNSFKMKRYLMAYRVAFHFTLTYFQNCFTILLEKWMK